MIEYNDKFDTILKDLVDNHPRSYFKTIKAKSNSELLKYIEDCTPLLGDKYLISTKVYWVLNRIQDFPKCRICGKKIKKDVKINEGYPSHCSAKCLSDDPDVQKHKEESYQKRYGDGITNPFQAQEVIKKIDETNFKKYNVRRYTQTKEYKENVCSRLESINSKKHKTHEENGSFNESKEEAIVLDILKRKFNNIETHYKSDEYPFDCDFYIKEKDLYIEYNGTWTHGDHPYDENNISDNEIVKMWKEKNTEYYNNAIYTWTDLDVRKRNHAKDNKLNFIELWTISDVFNLLRIDTFNELVYPYRRKRLDREYKFYVEKDANILTPYVSHKNEIVKYFQQDTFFKKEKELWINNLDKKDKLICNRIKYLNKNVEELTVDDILTGFKKSGIYYGYSHFNPLWFKWFNEKFHVKCCYDPCGGWGHRLLGSSNLEKYIYNDLSKTTKENVDRIIRHFKIKNVITYNNDAREFNPSEEFDAMFTCPPYYNVEEYECDGFKSLTDFNSFIDSIFNVFKFHRECKTFGLVIREDLLGSHTDFCDKIPLNVNDESYFDGLNNKNGEFLFIYKR